MGVRILDAAGSAEATGGTHEVCMDRALALAARSPLADPNPRVGCVLVTVDGRIVGEGWHRGAGTPHAEVVALRAAGSDAAGATAFVTLEPCNHQGRTGPCVQALLRAGVRRVVYGQTDPNRPAAGGAAALAAGGVDVLGGVRAGEATQLNEAWTFSVTRGRPFVTWKVAGTLDGRTAAADGTSMWITGPQAQLDVHRLRADCGAIVVGTGTVLADGPRLTVRSPDGRKAARQPVRVVVGRGRSIARYSTRRSPARIGRPRSSAYSGNPQGIELPPPPEELPRYSTGANFTERAAIRKARNAAGILDDPGAIARREFMLHPPAGITPTVLTDL